MEKALKRHSLLWKGNMAKIMHGFERNICACDDCKSACRHMSGMCAVQDIIQWQAQHGETFNAWALIHLAASPGALILRNGAIERLHTIVPARLPTGGCHWLTRQEMCAIHDDAPYGCAFFSFHLSTSEGNERSYAALADIAYDWETVGPYSRLWLRLDAEGRCVEAPEVARQRLRQP